MDKQELIALADDQASAHLEQWLFNTELECSGGSLWPIEEIAIGGAVLKMADLLTVLRYADRMQTSLRAIASQEGE